MIGLGAIEVDNIKVSIARFLEDGSRRSLSSTVRYVLSDARLVNVHDGSLFMFASLEN